MRKILSLIGVLLFLSGCSLVDPGGKGKLQEVYFGISPDGGRSAGNRAEQVDIDALLEQVDALYITLENRKGERLYNRYRMDLSNNTGSFLTASIKLYEDIYKILEYFIVDKDDKCLFATPIEGSEMDYLVNDPLPIEFNVALGEPTTIRPQVYEVSDSPPGIWGYMSFGFNVVRTFDFYVGAYVYDGDSGTYIRTMADISIAAGGKMLYAGTLAAENNAIKIHDGYEVYGITITKAGYKNVTRSYSNAQMKQFLNEPLAITLESGTTPDTNYTISGSVNYDTQDVGIGLLSLKNTTLILRDNQSEMSAVVTDDEGNFVLSNISNGTYTLIAQKKGWQFTPLSYTVLVNDGNVSGYAFTGDETSGYKVDSWAYAWDAEVRGPSTWAEAVALCKQLGGRLPTVTEIFRSNAATGPGKRAIGSSTNYLWTNIEYTSGYHVILRLSDGNVTYSGDTSKGYFRCVYPDKEYDYFARSYAYGPPGDEAHTLTINGNLFYMDKYDRPPLLLTSAAREAAFYHASVPSAHLYTVAVRSGLPNGSGNWLWSSDQEGYNSTQFLNGLVKWSGVDYNYDGSYSTYSSWDYTNSTTHGYRAAGIAAPVEMQPSRITNEWIDKNVFLRTETLDSAQTDYWTAIDLSLEKGGHMPTFLDMMQLIQGGLPYGSNLNLWTADASAGSSSAAYTTVVKWSNTDTHFTGMHSTYMTWAGRDLSNKFPYRTVYYPVNMQFGGPGSGYGGLFTVTKVNPEGKVVQLWMDNEDRPPVSYAEAAQACYERGGFLPSYRDMVEMIRSGLPNGREPQRLWTSDHTTYEYSKTITWNQVDKVFVDAGNIQNTRAASQILGFRCMWTNEIRLP